jgi:antitoxin (DNA-binding transcriptional repressor) of toxin-antitoxin stability system
MHTVSQGSPRVKPRRVKGGAIMLSALPPMRRGKAAMIESMATVHMSYNEVSNNFAAVLENIRKGVEVVVEQDHRPVALICLPTRSGRPISECIASAKASGSKVTLDGGFAHDVEEGIRERQEPWNPPSWD